MDQRTQFIADYLRDALAITELCEHYGVSRKTGYKWIEPYLRHGPAGLEERSRRPRRSPNETAAEIVTAILEARRRHPAWGGKKLLALLHQRHPRWSLPGRATAGDILSRHGMVPTRRYRRRLGHQSIGRAIHGRSHIEVPEEATISRLASRAFTGSSRAFA
jgi:putative transposase